MQWMFSFGESRQISLRLLLTAVHKIRCRVRRPEAWGNASIGLFVNCRTQKCQKGLKNV